jgi:hypothetical protein
MQIYALAKPIIILAYCCMTFIKYKQYPGKLGLEHSPAGLWNFEGNLNDSSGNGFYLSGTPLGYSIQANDFQYGVIFGGSEFSRPSRDAALAITGAITIEIVGIFMPPEYGVLEFFCSMGDSSETEASNTPFYWYFESSLQMTFLWEYGAGQNASVTSDLDVIPVGIPCFIACTRSSGNPATVNLYVNGRSVGSGTGPAGTGSTANTIRFRVGASNAGGDDIYYGTIMSSFKIIPYELSQEQIVSEYNKTLGNTMPFFRKQ